MRLDKFLTEAGVCSRSEAAKAARRQCLSVNGKIVRDAGMHIDPECDTVLYCRQQVVWKKHVYLMLNKPEGVVSATDDPKEKTVLDLLDERTRRLGLFPCGRLDKNTVGLVILTNDGQTAHRLLAPKSKTEKEYRFTVKFPLSDVDVQMLENGVTLRADSTAGAWTTAPCRLLLDEGNRGGIIILTEGKYHEIKRMMEAVHNQITSLARISFAGICLDSALLPGQWRCLTKEEEALFCGQDEQ